MGFIRNIIDYIGGIGVVNISNQDGEFVNDKRSYKINQNDKNYPFEEGFATSSDVYAIVNKIVKNAKTIPWSLKLQTGDKVETIESGQLYDLIQQPNKDQDLISFIESELLNLLLSGNIYLNSEKPYGMVGSLSLPSEIIGLHPQLMHIEPELKGRKIDVKNYEYHLDGKDFILSKDEIYHVKYANPTKFGINRLYGLSPLTAGFLTLKGLNNNQIAHASILDNMGVTGILSNESDYSLTPEQQDREQKALDKKLGGASKFGRVIQSSSKVKFTQLGLSPNDLKIIEGKNLKMRDLCNIYDISSVLFNDPQNRIQANLLPANTAMWNDAVIPNPEILMRAFERYVVKPYNE